MADYVGYLSVGFKSVSLLSDNLQINSISYYLNLTRITGITQPN